MRFRNQYSFNFYAAAVDLQQVRTEAIWFYPSYQTWPWCQHCTSHLCICSLPKKYEYIIVQREMTSLVVVIYCSLKWTHKDYWFRWQLLRRWCSAISLSTYLYLLHSIKLVNLYVYDMVIHITIFYLSSKVPFSVAQVFWTFCCASCCCLWHTHFNTVLPCAFIYV